MNARLSQELDSLMNVMETHINGAISLAINDRELPEIQNIIGDLPLDQNDTGKGTSLIERCFGKARKETNTKFAKKDSMSACDLRENTDFTR